MLGGNRLAGGQSFVCAAPEEVRSPGSNMRGGINANVPANDIEALKGLEANFTAFFCSCVLGVQATGIVETTAYHNSIQK